MGKILCIWELGNAFGHIRRLARIAEELIERDHDVSFVLSDLKHADATLSHLNAAYFQAPIWTAPVHNAPKSPASFAEILIHFGFTDPEGLTGLFNAWKNLYQQLRPDLVLVDYSPAAIIIARALGIKTAILSTGFCMPPDADPPPPLLPWMKATPKRLIKSQQQVLDTINLTLERLGMPRLRRFYDVFDVTERFLITYPELDFYPSRGDATYWGLLDSSKGKPVELPPPQEHEKPYIFAYLKRGYDRMVLDILRKLELPATVFAPAMPERYHSRFVTDKLRIFREPVLLDKVLAHSDIVICHVGHGTVVKALFAGNPLLLLPLHVEQRSISLRLEQLGVGIVPEQTEKPDVVESALRKLIDNPEYTQRAKAFAAKYAGEGDAAERIAKRCTELLA